MSKKHVIKDINTAYTEKLKSSVLTLQDAKQLGFKITEKPQTLEDHFYAAPAFVIPYTTPSGKPSGFYRVRYLYNTNKGILAQTKAKARRYDQPSSEIPQLYIPHILPNKKRWSDIFDNSEIPICITEGELKAACATKHGIPTLALGGVWNFKSNKNGLSRLPIFENINFKGRVVFIIFDSDSATNPQVLYAQYKFAEELFNLGAKPIAIEIPKQGDKKHGIDDYIHEFGIQAYKDLLADEDNHAEFQFVKELLRLNSEIGFVFNPPAIVHYSSGQLLNRSTAQLMYANAKMIKKKIVPAKTEDGDDTIKYAEANSFDEWTKWEQRGEVWSMSYEPGEPKFVDVQGRRHYNTWNGWGCEPEKGDVSLWRWLVDSIFKNARPEHKRWFEQWCAYPLQHPGTKMFSAPILFGQVQGTGKSLLGLTLVSIYGSNGAEITNTQLEDERNVFAAKKQFILGNEVTGSDKRSVGDRLKNLITQASVIINVKYQPDYTIRDTINYMFTSNHVDAVYMNDDDRRYFVHEVLGPRLVDLDNAKVVRYDRWLKSGEAAKAVFHHLLQVDLTGFDPFGPAPDTVSKKEMVAASLSEVEAWCFKLKEDPDTCLRHGQTIVKFRLYRIKDLVAFYSNDGRKVYEKAFANALRKAGFKKAALGNSCPTNDGRINLWVVREHENKKFQFVSPKDCGDWYDSERELPAKKFAVGGKR